MHKIICANIWNLQKYRHHTQCHSNGERNRCYLRNTVPTAHVAWVRMHMWPLDTDFCERRPLLCPGRPCTTRQETLCASSWTERLGVSQQYLQGRRRPGGTWGWSMRRWGAGVQLQSSPPRSHSYTPSQCLPVIWSSGPQKQTSSRAHSSCPQILGAG